VPPSTPDGPPEACGKNKIGRAVALSVADHGDAGHEKEQPRPIVVNTMPTLNEGRSCLHAHQRWPGDTPPPGHAHPQQGPLHRRRDHLAHARPTHPRPARGLRTDPQRHPTDPQVDRTATTENDEPLGCPGSGFTRHHPCNFGLDSTKIQLPESTRPPEDHGTPTAVFVHPNTLGSTSGGRACLTGVATLVVQTTSLRRSHPWTQFHAASF
jgi:hypothetical protein